MHTLLIIGSVWPEPSSSAAGWRMMQLMHLFQSAGFEITFASASEEGRYAVSLDDENISTQKIEMNSSTFDDFVDDLQPSIVMFDRFITEEQFGWRVAEQCPNAMRILDTEDLHCLRRARKKAVKAELDFKEEHLLQEDNAKREVASIYRCDLSLIISEYEMKLLSDLFSLPASLLYYVPFMLEPMDKKKIEEWPSFAEREHFISVGNFRHAPNRDAVQYLYHQIWPLIRKKLPKAQMHVYGAYPSKKAGELHQPEQGFLIKGRVDDAAKVVRKARVCLAPLRFGAGLKGKLIEAMQCGTPSVTTPIGAEGLAGDELWCGMIEGTPSAFAEAAIELYTNPLKWKKAQLQGQEIINQRLNKKKIGPTLLQRIKQLQAHLTAHRHSNFIGAMLMHHTTASTKYMAKWIEAKNR